MLTSRFAIRAAIAMIAVGVTAEPRAAGKPKLQSIRPKTQCTAMVGFIIPANKIALPTRGAKIKTAELKAASGQVGSPEYLPEYCEIVGAIAPVDPAAPDIQFGVDIPTLWNQKAWHVGGQGNNGIIPVNLAAVWRDGQQGFRPGSPLNQTYPPDAPTMLGRGFATFGGDSGHQNPPPPPPGQPAPNPNEIPAWELNEEAWTNYTYAGLKKTHDVAMQIMKAMYGTEARILYFGGQSNGGRDALNVANMFPEDYDGVLAAGPLTYWSGWGIEASMRVKAQLAPGAWVPPSKAAAIRDETLRLCDNLDGLNDNVIQNYVGCNRLLDPTITPDPLAKIRCPGGADTGDTCLSDAQMATVNSWHAPLKYGYALANGETDWPGEPTGSEAPQGWLISQRQPTPDTLPGFNAFTRGGLRMKDFNAINLDFATHQKQIQAMSKLMDNRADWTKLLSRGSKLIYYSPGSDYLISARAQARIYEEAKRKAGEAAFAKGVRYYVGPGLGHGGKGVDAKGRILPQFVDLLTPLENWVENGVTPPEPLVQTHMEAKPPYTVTRSRPLCRYPQYPHYNGSGDPDVAPNYTCRDPNPVRSSK